MVRQRAAARACENKGWGRSRAEWKEHAWAGERVWTERAHQLWQGDGRVAVGRNQALHELAAGQRLHAGQVALFGRRASAHIHALEACRQLRLDRQGLATRARSERTHVVRDAPWRVGAEAERLEGQLVGEGCTQSRVVDQHHCDG